MPLKQSIVEDMHKPERFKTYLGDEKYYHDFLVFFQKEIEAKSWQKVLNEYLFANDERANDMLGRLYAGFLHPIIHLGFGIEFQQPAIIAEALAQTAVHDNWMNSLFLGCEKAAEAHRGKNGPKKTIVQLLEEAKNNDKLRNAPQFDHGNKIRDGILKHAPKEMIEIASQYTIEEDELEEKTAEMINAAGEFPCASSSTPSLTYLESTLPAQHRSHPTRSSSTFSTCTASIAASFSRILSLRQMHSSRPLLSGASWNGRSGTTSSCTSHVAVHHCFLTKSQTTSPPKTQTGTASSSVCGATTMTDMQPNSSAHLHTASKRAKNTKTSQAS